MTDTPFRELPPAEQDAALKAKAWRKPATPPPAATPKVNALDMNAQQFNQAVRNREWRD